MSSHFHKKVSLNLIAQLFGKGGSTLIAFVTLSVMARYLGEIGIGQYGTVIKFIGIFGLIADFGLNVISTRELSKPGINHEEVLGNAFALRFVMSIAVLIFAPLTALLFPYSTEIKWAIFFSVPAFLFLLWTGVLSSVLQKNLRSDKIAIADIAVKLFTFLGVVLAIYLGGGLYSMVFALLTGNIAGFFVTWIYSSKYLHLRFLCDFRFWKKLAIYSYPIALTNFFILIYFNIDTIFLSIMKGSFDTGIYHVSYRVLETIAHFAFTFSMLFIPFFTEHISLKNIDRFLEHFYLSIKYILALALPVTFVGIISAPWIIRILVGDGFHESILVLQILFGAVFFVFFNSLINNTLTVLELQKKAVKIYAFGAVFNIVTNAIFIPYYSYYAAAVTTVLSEGLIFIGTSLLLHHWVNENKQRGKLEIGN